MKYLIYSIPSKYVYQIRYFVMQLFSSKIKKKIFQVSIDRFSNNETRIMINNFSLRGLILMKLKI